MKRRAILFDLPVVLVLGLAIAFVGAAVIRAQPPVPHPVEKGAASFEDCLACHRAGLGDGPPVPADHQPYDNETCGVCHSVAEFAAPAIPHPEERAGTPFEDCVSCHREGVNGAPAMPSDHQDRDNEDCALCHATHLLPGPAIPHPEKKEGTPFQDCVFCHRAGLVDAPVMRANHELHGNEDCTLCHATTRLAPPSLPHVRERACADCHRTGAYGAPLLPADHQAHGDEDCFVCHATAGLAAPAFPALAEGRQNCLSCHHDTVPEGARALEDIEHDHSIYTGDTCLSCHRPARETGITEGGSEETGERPRQSTTDGGRFVFLEGAEDAQMSWRDALLRRWAVIIAAAAISALVFTVFRPS